MLRLSQLKDVVEVCRKIARTGFINGVNAFVPELEIDVLVPPCDFLGAVGNPAIFVNEQTYKLLGGIHETWIANRTIAIKDSFLELSNIEIIGAIVHETGHAFNVAAGIENSEANAYIFEIEVLRALQETGILQQLDCAVVDLNDFLNKRLTYYYIEQGSNPYLSGLITTIERQSAVTPTPAETTEKNVKSLSLSGYFRFFEKICLDIEPPNVADNADSPHI